MTQPIPARERVQADARERAIELYVFVAQNSLRLMTDDYDITEEQIIDKVAAALSAEAQAAREELRPFVTYALKSVLDERKRQDEKWGEQNHSPEWWLAILGEEFGEVCQAALHANFGGPEAGNYRKEMVHTAAVALQAIECFDRAAHARGRE